MTWMCFISNVMPKFRHHLTEHIPSRARGETLNSVLTINRLLPPLDGAPAQVVRQTVTAWLDGTNTGTGNSSLLDSRLARYN